MAVFLTHTSQEGGECRESVVGVTHCVTRYVSGHVFSFKLIDRLVMCERENGRDVDCQK